MGSITIGVSVLMLVVGSVVSNITSFTNPKPGEPPSSVAGIIVCVVSLMAASLKPVVAMVVMSGSTERPKLAPTLVLFYDTALAFWLMLFYWLCSNERQESITYLTDPKYTTISIV